MSSSVFLNDLAKAAAEKKIPDKFKRIMEEFYLSYKSATSPEAISNSRLEELFRLYLQFSIEQCNSPFVFQSYHEQIRHPFDYYEYGLDFVRPLVNLPLSSIEGLSALHEIEAALKRKENVILLANHQTEADPQAISVLLEKGHPALAAEMIFVAGDRVVTDPLAIPFSMGRNLLCIYSKKYIDHPPEQKTEKQLHNKRTMEVMKDLLKEGGKCIYVAPSGGRDRPDDEGIVRVAPFDPQSIEMFHLMAQKAGKPTHFYPLTLVTYHLLPPPAAIQIELGEKRSAKRSAIHLAFGNKIDMEHFPGSTQTDKHVKRQARANYIHELVERAYNKLGD